MHIAAFYVVAISYGLATTESRGHSTTSFVRGRGTLRAARRECSGKGGLYPAGIMTGQRVTHHHKSNGLSEKIWVPIQQKILEKFTWTNGTEYKNQMRQDRVQQQYCVRVILGDNMLENVKCNIRRKTAAMCQGSGIWRGVGTPVPLKPNRFSVVLLEGDFTWHGARQACRRYGSDLAVLPFNAAGKVGQFLNETFGSRDDVKAYWIGISKEAWVPGPGHENYTVEWCDSEPFDDSTKTAAVWVPKARCVRTASPDEPHAFVCNEWLTVDDKTENTIQERAQFPSTEPTVSQRDIGQIEHNKMNDQSLSTEAKYKFFAEHGIIEKQLQLQTGILTVLAVLIILILVGMFFIYRKLSSVANRYCATHV